MMKFRPPLHPKVQIFLLCIAAGFLSSLIGCSHSAQFGTLTVTTNYPAGTTLQLQTESDQVAFQTVQTVVVTGTDAQFIRLTPGEYRLVAIDASGQTLQTSASFGAGVGETTIAFNAQATGGSS